MQVFHDKGVCVKGSKRFYIDCSGSNGDATIVTHAHSDHARSLSSSKVLLTPETLSLVRERIKKGTKPKPLSFGKKFRDKDMSVRLYNSGHILGSAQACFEGSRRVVVTSDFKLQDSLITKRADIVDCDILLIETTFGKPDYEFPERETVYREMEKWLKSNLDKNNFIVLSGYSTGKAQELTRIVTEFTGETPLVDSRAFKNNDIYKQHGVKLGPYTELNGNLKDGRVLIVPPSMLNQESMQALSLSLSRKPVYGIATGWNRGGKNLKAFPLSDHADFKQLMHYVEQSQPKLVLTHHGFAGEFARAVTRRFGIPARPLGGVAQKTLSEFGG